MSEHELLYSEHEAWAVELATRVGGCLREQHGLPRGAARDAAQSGRVGLWKAILVWRRQSALRTLAYKYVLGEVVRDMREQYAPLRTQRNAPHWSWSGDAWTPRTETC